MTDYRQGSTATLDSVFLDQPGGSPIDPTGITLIILFNGATVGGPFTYPANVTRQALGLYSYGWSVPTDAPLGEYVAEWTATISAGTRVGYDTFNVVPGVSPVLGVGPPSVVPYVTTAEFVEWPTFLDLLNLRSGDPQLTHQTSVLNKTLLTASTWCDSYVDLGAGADATLAAHTRVENKRMRPDRAGRLLLHPDHIPFVSLESIAYGRYLGGMTAYTSPPVFVEDGRSVVLDVGKSGGSWSGSLQFGVSSSAGELYTSWSYTAGFPNALLTGPVAAGGQLLPVSDVTGIQPGQQLRVFDPGLDESVIVSTFWAATVGPAILPLTSGLLHNHTLAQPVRVSVMPLDIFEACALYTIALLMRPDTKAEDAFPDMKGGVSTRLADSRADGSGLVGQARELLESYRRVI